MLGKLIKNDMRAAARGVSNVYLAAMIAIAAMGICLFADVGVGKVIASILLILVSIATIIVTIVATLGEFRRGMFGDRGYLTHTLPVKGPTALFSKLVTSFCWIVISYLLVFFCAWLAYYYWMGESSDSLVYMIAEMLPELGMPEKSVLLETLVFIAIKGVFLIVVFITEVFFALTLANVRPFSALGGFGSVLYFFASFGLVVFLSSRAEKLFMTAVLVNADRSLTFTTDPAAIAAIRSAGGASVTLTQVYVEIVAAVLLFIVTAELIDKKINIK